METTVGLLGLLVGFLVTLWVALRIGTVAAPLIVGFTLRAVLAVIDALVVKLPGAGDGVGWDRVAAYYARDGLEGTFSYIGTGHALYIWCMSALYALVGRSPLLIQSINVLLGTLMIAVVFRLSGVLSSDDRAPRRAAWLTAVFPSLIFFSSVLLREVAVSVPLLLSVLHLVRWYRDRALRSAVLALLFLLLRTDK